MKKATLEQMQEAARKLIAAGHPLYRPRPKTIGDLLYEENRSHATEALPICTECGRNCSAIERRHFDQNPLSHCCFALIEQDAGAYNGTY